MDKRLEKALDFSNFRMILATRQENLKLLMNNKLMLTYGGGLFKIDKEVISFIVALMIRKEKKFIFIDRNDIPIEITNLKEFYEEAIEKYRKALQQYHQSYKKLSEVREMRKVIDWDEKEKA
jgi:hypothetical protein